MIAVVKE